MSEIKAENTRTLFRIAVAENPCRQLDGSDLVPSAPCRAVIYPWLGYGVVAAQSGVDRVLGAELATWGANAWRGVRACERGTLGAVCARCGRGALGAVCARCGLGTLGAVCARNAIYNLLHLNL